MKVRVWPVRGFTLVELLVVVAVITILASMLMPAVTTAMRQAGSAKCKSNLDQIGKACMIYANQYDSFMPCYGSYAYITDSGGNRVLRDGARISPQSLIFNYVKDENLYVCPADPTPENCVWWAVEHPGLIKSSYMWSEHIMTYPQAAPLPNYRNPHELGLVADGWECPNGWTWQTCVPPWRWPSGISYGSRIDWEHDGSVNMLYGDQHVERVDHEHVAAVRSDPR